MEYEILRMNWSKRRTPEPMREVSSVSIPGFKKEQYLLCKMFVTFLDGGVAELTGQVAQHPIKKYWRVNGINTHGDHVAIKVLE